jgi:hypothetical protein
MAKAQAREATAASNKKAAVKEAPAEDAENSEGGSDGPVLDLTDAGVKKMIKLAKQRGFVTYDELNEVLPSDEVSSEQIEDIMAMLTDMGINVVETEEESEDTTEVAESAQTGVVKSESNSRPHRRSGAHVPARDGLGRTAVARGRNRHRQAHRGRPRGDDRGPVRKPADLPGHHHLARRTERRQDSAARHHRPRGHLCRPDAKKAEAPTPEERERKEKGPQGRRKSVEGAAEMARNRPRRGSDDDVLSAMKAEQPDEDDDDEERPTCRSPQWKRN